MKLFHFLRPLAKTGQLHAAHPPIWPGSHQGAGQLVARRSDGWETGATNQYVPILQESVTPASCTCQIWDSLETPVAAFRNKKEVDEDAQPEPDGRHQV